jgi:hypothetical protein
LGGVELSCKDLGKRKLENKKETTDLKWNNMSFAFFMKIIMALFGATLFVSWLQVRRIASKYGRTGKAKDYMTDTDYQLFKKGRNRYYMVFVGFLIIIIVLSVLHRNGYLFTDK